MTISISKITELRMPENYKDNLIDEINNVDKIINQMLDAENLDENKIKLNFLDDYINKEELYDKVNQINMIKKIGYDLIIKSLKENKLNE